jgi:hypothetical protein
VIENLARRLIDFGDIDDLEVAVGAGLRKPSIRRASEGGSGSSRQPELIVLGAEPSVQPLGVVVENRLPEVGLIEDALEDVLVHAPHDRVEERAGEDEAEVLEVVVAGTSGQFLVRCPRLLELIEEELVGVSAQRSSRASQSPASSRRRTQARPCRRGP